MIRSAAAAVPVVADFIDAEKLGFSVVADTGVDGIAVLLLYARWAHTELLG
jgi:hypothetical protein